MKRTFVDYLVDSESSVVIKSSFFDVDKTYDHISYLCLIFGSRDGYAFSIDSIHRSYNLVTPG